MDGVRMNRTFNDVAGKLNFLSLPVSVALPLFELFLSETDTFSKTVFSNDKTVSSSNVFT